MVDEAGNVAVVDEYGRVRKGGSKRFVKELEERAKLQKELESKGKGKGKGRKSSSASSKQANRNRRRSNNMGVGAGHHQSQSPSRRSGEPPEIPARFSSPASASASAAPISAVPQYLSPGQPSNPGYSYQDRNYSDAEYPNWRLVWNEGTDAVMDVPIGGVCEVLYGGDPDSGTF